MTSAKRQNVFIFTYHFKPSLYALLTQRNRIIQLKAVQSCENAVVLYLFEKLPNTMI